MVLTEFWTNDQVHFEKKRNKNYMKTPHLKRWLFTLRSFSLKISKFIRIPEIFIVVIVGKSHAFNMIDLMVVLNFLTPVGFYIS